jgi:DNA-binding GntR family transcriptional regulator
MATPRRTAFDPAYTPDMEFQGKSDSIAAALRELIITGEVEPGAALRQRDIAERFGVSATPVREALRRLEAEGLVEHDLHRSVRVRGAKLDADEEGFQMRAALEALAARLAAQRATDGDLEEIAEIHARLAAAPIGDPEATELNRRFHFRIYEASGSPVLIALLRLLWQSFRQAPQIVRAQPESVRQHEAIVAALRRHDADDAERLTREHILSALELFLDAKRAPDAPAVAGD